MAPPDLNDPEVREQFRAAILNETWRTGNLAYRLKDTQQKIHARLVKNDHRRHFLLCSRRLGKTDLLFTRACEVALSKPNARILWLAPTGKDAALIAKDTSLIVLRDCPEYLRPTYRAQPDHEFLFKNGSVIRLRGTNGDHAKDLRGGAYDIVIMDEAGLMDDFRHVLNDVVEPMVLTTRGHVLIATTPPRSPGHECVGVYEEYARLGSTSVYTLRDADEELIPFEEKCRALVSAGEKLEDAPGIIAGRLEPQTTTAKREFFCQFVTDASLAIVPEFTLDKQKEIVREHVRPAYFNIYAGVDPGSRDNTGIIYAYVDFVKGVLVVEAEALLSNPTTEEIAKTLTQIETDVFQGREPKSRTSDIDLRLIQDLQRLYKIRLVPADKKDGMLSSINLLRHFVQQNKIIINPRCTNLIRQLSIAIWDRKATDMARATGDSVDGHMDLIAALRYMLRAVNFNANPFPEGWNDPGGGGGVPSSRFVSKRPKPKTGDLLGGADFDALSQRLSKLRGKF